MATTVTRDSENSRIFNISDEETGLSVRFEYYVHNENFPLSGGGWEQGFNRLQFFEGERKMTDLESSAHLDLIRENAAAIQAEMLPLLSQRIQLANGVEDDVVTGNGNLFAQGDLSEIREEFVERLSTSSTAQNIINALAIPAFYDAVDQLETLGVDRTVTTSVDSEEWGVDSVSRTVTDINANNISPEDKSRFLDNFRDRDIAAATAILNSADINLTADEPTAPTPSETEVDAAAPATDAAEAAADAAAARAAQAAVMGMRQSETPEDEAAADSGENVGEPEPNANTTAAEPQREPEPDAPESEPESEPVETQTPEIITLAQSETAELQSLLLVLGYSGVGPIDDIEGDMTRDAASAFAVMVNNFTETDIDIPNDASTEEIHAIMVDLMNNDSEFRDTLIERAQNEVSQGRIGADPNMVRAIQAMVGIGDREDIAIDGILGTQTLNALQQFASEAIAPAEEAAYATPAAHQQGEPAQPARSATQSGIVVDPALIEAIRTEIEENVRTHRVGRDDRIIVPSHVSVDGVRYEVPDDYDIEQERNGDFTVTWQGSDFREDVSVQIGGRTPSPAAPQSEIVANRAELPDPNLVQIEFADGSILSVSRDDLLDTLDQMDYGRYLRIHFEDVRGDDREDLANLSDSLKEMIRNGEGGALSDEFNRGNHAAGTKAEINTGNGETYVIDQNLADAIRRGLNIRGHEFEVEPAAPAGMSA